MSKEERRNLAIDTFIERWNEMLIAANAIEGFEWKFGVTITTDTSLDEERFRAIDGVNRCFADNNMNYKSNRNC